MFAFNPKFIVLRKSDGSSSVHMFGDFKTSLKMMKIIVKGIDKDIDTNPYVGGKSLRLPMTKKLNEDRKLPDKHPDRFKVVPTHYVCQEHEFIDCLINVPSFRDIPEFENPIGFIDRPHLSLNRELWEYSENTEEITKQLIGIFGHHNFNIERSAKTIYMRWHDGFKCPVGNREHNNVNRVMLNETDKTITVLCYQ